MTYLLVELTAFLLIAFALGVALGWAIWARLDGSETAIDRAWRWMMVRLGFASDDDLERAERAEAADAARFAQLEARFAETDAAARARIADLSQQVVSLTRGDRVAELEEKLRDAEAEAAEGRAAAERVSALEADLAAAGAAVAERDESRRRVAELESAASARPVETDATASAARVAALEEALSAARAAAAEASAERSAALERADASERRAEEAETAALDAELRVATAEAAGSARQPETVQPDETVQPMRFAAVVGSREDGPRADGSLEDGADQPLDAVGAARADALARELDVARARIAELEAAEPSRDARGRIAVLRAHVGQVEPARPELLDAPRRDGPDDLKRIKGVGPKLEGVLHGLGVYHFDQIAEWTDAEVAWVDDHLRFRGRIGRDDWIAQAKVLAGGGETEFSARSA